MPRRNGWAQSGAARRWWRVVAPSAHGTSATHRPRSLGGAPAITPTMLPSRSSATRKVEKPCRARARSRRRQFTLQHQRRMSASSCQQAVQRRRSHAERGDRLGVVLGRVAHAVAGGAAKVARRAGGGQREGASFVRLAGLLHVLHRARRLGDVAAPLGGRHGGEVELARGAGTAQEATGSHSAPLRGDLRPQPKSRPLPNTELQSRDREIDDFACSSSSRQRRSEARGTRRTRPAALSALGEPHKLRRPQAWPSRKLRHQHPKDSWSAPSRRGSR